MNNPSGTLISIPLDQQISTLSYLADRIRTSLQSTGQNIPQDVYDGITQLTGQLNRISRKVANHEEERSSLLALAEISQLVNSTLEIDEVLQIVMDTIVRLSGAERGFLMLRNENQEMEIRTARNWEQESIHPSEFAISHTVINRVMNEGVPILTTNAQEDPRFGGQESIIAYSLRSIICVPLKVKGTITGVIYADNRIRTGLFTEAERDILNTFANQAAVAIENARLFESVRKTLAEVTELKNLMDNVFASIASGVITADIEDKIMLCNRAAEYILGTTSDMIIGNPLKEFNPQIAEELNEFINTVVRDNQQIIGQEIRVHLQQKGIMDLIFNISPLRDAAETTQGVAIVLDDLTEKKRLEAQRRMFERMVSPAVIRHLDPDKLQLGGNRGEITSLFADIRGFTSFSEKLDPEELISVLNRYLSAGADAVLEQEGTIDKFNGDEIMAWFNAPIAQQDHPLRAVRSAINIRDSIKKLHTEFPPHLQLSFGIGIHSGDAVLGLVGTETRLEYTAIGDSINTAHRIMENAEKNQVLISETVYQFVHDSVVVREVEPVHAKGKSKPLVVYEVLTLKE